MSTAALLCLIVPWAYYPHSGFGPLAEMLAPAALWKIFWPVATGVILALVLRRWNHRLPRIPEGDIAALGGPVSRLAAACGEVFARLDGVLRLWATACLALIVIVVLLTAAMRAGG